MRTQLSILLLLMSFVGFGQSPRFTIVKLNSVQRDPNEANTWWADAQLKATAGTLTLDFKYAEVLLPSGDKGYARVELYGDLKTGQTGGANLQVFNAEPKVGQVFGPRGTFPIKAPASRAFEGVISQAFLGSGKDEYNLVLDRFSGYLLVGDVLQGTGPGGQWCQATVQTFSGGVTGTVDMLSPAMPRVMVDVKSAGCVLDSKYKITLSGTKTMQAETVAGGTGTSAGKSGTFKGKRTVFPVNTVLKTKEVTITLHDVVQYFPAPDGFTKIDPNLNYYVLDATVENSTSKVVDAGDYTLRLNFYDAKGESADEFGRLFKNDKNKTDDASRGADVLDKAVFGGSSALRFAGIHVSYTTNLPTYDQKKYDAVWGNLQPGQQVRCEAVKVIGVPKEYVPTAIGTWKDSRRNLVTTPIALK